MTPDYDALATAWYEAFNRHDLAAIMDLYAEDVNFTSPYIRAIGFAKSATLTSKADVMRYFEAGLSRIPDLQFTPVANCIGADGHVLVYKNQADVCVAESHEYDAEARIIRASAAYAAVTV